MQTDKIKSIIEDKNNQLERDALREAEHIIEHIAQKQETVTKLNKDIEDLRKHLSALEIKQLDSTTILGE